MVSKLNSKYVDTTLSKQRCHMCEDTLYLGTKKHSGETFYFIACYYCELETKYHSSIEKAAGEWLQMSLKPFGDKYEKRLAESQ